MNSGDFSFRPLRPLEDMATVHAWVSQERARYWGLVGKSSTEVSEAYRAIASKADVFLGWYEGAPAFLLERYHPREDPIADHYEAQVGDRGLHVLIAPTTNPRSGFSWAVFQAVMEFIFLDPSVERVVVEPDIRNRKIHALNRRAGFRYQRPVVLPHKVAHLALCTRQDFAAAIAQDGKALVDAQSSDVESPRTAHLRPELWAQANLALVRKAIVELSHERLLEPQLIAEDGDWARFSLSSDVPGTVYGFRARRFALHHLQVDPGSIQKQTIAGPAEIDAIDFILEFRERLGIRPLTLQVYLEEITSTLYSTCYKRAVQRLSAADLVHADFQEIETAMTEGHPGFVANSGRVGFDASDFSRYAPEAGAPVRLIWLAAHRNRAELSCAHDLSPEQLWFEELGEETLLSFRASLSEQGLDPNDYLFLPVHPWQWYDKLVVVFASDLARRDLVCLGPSDDDYRAQQSIRTFFNTSRPERRYIKTALSVLNMGFMRGLSADYMRDTPAINDYLDALVRADPYLQARGFELLREQASIGYRNEVFDLRLPAASPYRKMLAALFRESPAPRLRENQRLMTMAALLHRDRDGATLLPQLIAASGLAIEDWLARYLDCYLAPLLHCLYRYELAFMPHGENVILLLEDNAPRQAFMKDIAEEAVFMNAERELPERVRRLAVSVPDDLKALCIFTDVFDGILRFMSEILVTQAGYDEVAFWRGVAACIRRYQQSQPALSDKFERYDLFAETFAHSCLNRLQLRNNRQLIDLSDPASSLLFAGTLDNPIARFRSQRLSSPV